MMKRLLVACGMVFIVLACSSISEPELAINKLVTDNKVSPEQKDSIASVLKYYPNNTQLAIAIINDSTATFYGALRKQDTLKTIENRDRVFEIGSLTKVFTSALMVHLANEGKIEINDPIQHYLDFDINTEEDITFKQLSNHTSGVPRLPSGFFWESIWHMDNPYKDYDVSKLREYMSTEMKLDTLPGVEHQYSNLGAGILGYVLGIADDKRYEEMLQHYIVSPLEMTRTTTIRKNVKEQLIAGLSKRGSVTSNWDLAALKGAGAILSTAEDLSKFGIANVSGQDSIFQKMHQKTFTINDGMDIGLGWFILKRDSGDRWHWHNGGTGGYRSSMTLDINDRKGVIVLSNISAGHKASSKIDKLGKVLLESLYE
ncbi:serine hydrolase domain-containing protein [Fodinibius halophilus]|uniref:Beta-lactamase family protein n=1 Tax=Fodinibius halophilus TaxID=1736908 RepID=A0A6M1T7Z4_9BACT|nr:serine hydrolase domain-containing protein [Fodinibius halophilus]NGP88091.1 beta-lactamase family protein [Fodinibius halophilus]